MSESITPPPPTVPAGWYNDGQGRLRWWDGYRWTDAYAPVVVQAPLAVQTPRAPFSGISIAGFILSCVGFVFAATSVLGILLGLFGLIVSIGGYADKTRRGRGLAVAGIIVGASAITLAVLLLLRSFTGLM